MGSVRACDLNACLTLVPLPFAFSDVRRSRAPSFRWHLKVADYDPTKEDHGGKLYEYAIPLSHTNQTYSSANPSPDPNLDPRPVLTLTLTVNP